MTDRPAEYDDEEPRRRIVATPANVIKMRAPKWLLDWRIPSNAITLLAGREGIGKSTIAFDLVARLTRGELPGRYFGTPRSVGVIASEDSWESVILPRLRAARADTERVFRIEARDEANQIDMVCAPLDLPAIAEACAEHDIALLILDPVMSIIHGRIDTHKDREVRQALEPLARFCAEYHVAVLGLIHVNKSGTSDPLNSVMASRAFTAVARSVLYCIVDPEAESEDRFLFGHPKSNLGPKQPTMAYRLIGCKLEIEDEDDPQERIVTTSRVAWEGVDTRSIRDAMETAPKERPTGEVSHRVTDFLRQRGAAASVAEIAAALPDVQRNTLVQNLARMAKRGTVTRPTQGLYGLPADDRENDTSLETSLVSSLSLVSSRMTGVTGMTPVQVSSGVSSPLSLFPDGDPICPQCQFTLDSNGHRINCQEAA